MANADVVVDHKQWQVGQCSSARWTTQQPLHWQHLSQHLSIIVWEGQTALLVHSVHRHSTQQVSHSPFTFFYFSPKFPS